MKHFYFLLPVLFLSLSVFSQDNAHDEIEVKFATPFSWEIYQPLQVSENDSIPALHSMFAAGIEWQILVKKLKISVGSNFGFSTQEKFGYESQVSSVSFELYGGRMFKLAKWCSLAPEIGYNFVGYTYSLTNTNQVLDFDQVFETNMRQFHNSAHRIVPRVSFHLFKEFQVSTSYHWAVSQNRWKVDQGKLLNSPRENFSAWRFTIGYYF
jgi:hypothetical protein